jgi:hypothetical protein
MVKKMENGYMYKENEKVKLLIDYKKDDPDNHIPEGSELIFLRATDVGTKSYVTVKFEDRILHLPELAIAPTETDVIDELKKFNKLLINSNPELGVYHHNVIIRTYHKTKIFLYNILILPVKNFLTRNSKPVKVEHDLSDLKRLINDDAEYDDF